MNTTQLLFFMDLDHIEPPYIDVESYDAGSKASIMLAVHVDSNEEIFVNIY